MRNFKKFLALVLAMLMVSACAVSVSAAFADQDAIVAADANVAVNTLAELGVIKGREDGKFYPNDTLTREEACVIFAKLRAGAEGQKYEWAEETTPFADVTAKWSFAYINYAYRNGFMVGDGTNFNPKDVLTIEQALCAAVKAFKGDKASGQKSGIQLYAERVEAIGEHAYWAGHYTDIAAELGLTENVPFNYTAPCTRATMAQIAYNLFKTDKSIEKAFNLTTLEGALTVVAADTATIHNKEDGKDVKVVRSVLEASLAENGFDGTLTDYIGAEFTVKYDSENGTVYSAALKSGMLVFDSTDVILSINKDKDNNNTNTLTLAGKTYRANELGDNGGSGLIGGAGKYPEITVVYTASDLTGDENAAIACSTDKILNDLPKHYKAFAYDDNTDGNYDRLVIKQYTLATIKANTKDAKDGVAFDTVTFFKTFTETVEDEEVTKNVTFTNYGLKENKAPIVYTGVDAARDNYTPSLINISYNAGTNSYVVDTLEVAVKKTGLLTGITTGKSIKIDGEALAYDVEAIAPAYTTLNQTATVFVIAGKYVKVAATDTSSSMTIMVESVKINEAGNAVVTGYNVNNRFSKEEITVIGIAGSKLVNNGAFRYDAEELEDGTKQAQLIYLASKKDADVKFEIVDGKYYTITTTEKGSYIADADKTIATPVDTYYNLSVGDYVKFATVDGATAVARYNVDAPAVVKIVNGGDAGKKDIYDVVKYEISTSLSAVESVNAAFELSNGKVKVVVISAASITGDVIIANPLAEGETIVQIIKAAHEVGFDADTYKAVDLMKGTVVDVTGVDAVVGNYYVANAEYKLGANLDGKWVFDTSVTYTFNKGTEDAEDDVTVTNLNRVKVYYDGILPSVKAYPTQLKKDLNAKDNGYYAEQVKVNGDKTVYSTIDQIKIYVGSGEDNVIALNSDGTVKTLKAADVLNVEQLNNKAIAAGTKYTNADGKTVTFKSVDTYVVGSSMILVMDIETK